MCCIFFILLQKIFFRSIKKEQIAVSFIDNWDDIDCEISTRGALRWWAQSSRFTTALGFIRYVPRPGGSESNSRGCQITVQMLYLRQRQIIRDSYITVIVDNIYYYVYTFLEAGDFNGNRKTIHQR